jgi:hypothetical protein
MDRLSYLATLETIAPLTHDSEEQLLERMIKHAIERETHQGIKDLNIEVLDGLIVVSGTCSTFYLKQIAQETGKRYADGRRFVNEISVGPGLPR